MRHPILLAGTEFVAPDLPDGAQVIEPPEPQPGIENIRDAVARALENPLDGLPLADRVRERDRVLIVFDGPAFPVPPMRADPRVPAIDALLDCLAARGLGRERVRLLCATGLGRRHTAADLTDLVGVRVAATHEVACHDAEDLDSFVDLGSTTEGEPVVLNAALTQADLVITVGLAQLPINAGWSTLATGLASVRTSRAIFAPENFVVGPPPFDTAGSRWQKALRRVGQVLERRLQVFHLELAIDTRLWPPALAGLFRADAALPTALVAANRFPEPLRSRAGRLFRAEYQTIGVFAGSTARAHACAVQRLYERAYATVLKPFDIVILGVPQVGPGMAGALDNPVLAATYAFGYLLGWHRGKPLLKQGGAVVLLNPMTERFRRPRYAAFADFYERILPETLDPVEMARRFEVHFAGRPEYVGAYRRRQASHGLAPFHAWYLAAPMRTRASRIICVGAETRVARRLGFEAATTLAEAIATAREAFPHSATLAVPALPPAFGVRIP